MCKKAPKSKTRKTARAVRYRLLQYGDPIREGCESLQYDADFRTNEAHYRKPENVGVLVVLVKEALERLERLEAKP